MRGRLIWRRESSDDDDDGFIEDNYIQATEREEDKEEEIQQEDAEYSDDELVIPYVNWFSPCTVCLHYEYKIWIHYDIFISNI